MERKTTIRRALARSGGALLLAVASGAAAQEPEAFVVRHAKLDLAIDYDARQLRGAMTFEMENWTARPTRRVSFLLHRLMEATDVRDDAGAALPHTQDVLRIRDHSARQVTQLVVTLPHAIAPGKRTTVRIDYAGYLTPYSEVGWLYVRDRVDSTFTIIRSDALAFPDIGGLSDAANRRRPRTDFTYDAAVRVPSRYLVATGGAVQRTAHADGTTTWRYTSGKPSSVLNISIAPFDTLSAGGVRLFYFREDSVGARRIMAGTQAALQTMAQWFGPLRTNVNLTITEIPDGWGSQASLVGGIIQSAAAFRDASRAGELYHELSHLWNVVDTERPSPRWNEGLASFLEGLLQEHVDGWKGRVSYESRLLPWLKQRAASDSALRTTPFIDYGRRGMTDAAYGVGHVMFATLFDLVGEREFNAILGGFYQTYGDGGTTRDLMTFAKRTATRDLTPFFDDWLLTPRWTVAVDSATSVSALADRYRRAGR